ncbi:MAG TPA: bifunctional proline dehydrogenase/L-glutamate gamma-semialdehyde dehydrogenase PutA [Burkholderiales bacterium]|nr:bifunctional proline dehydrogenase/L-glutamate gamma-semialdehyde dehydrogenase PutA [Burkholderiales bacterium]
MTEGEAQAANGVDLAERWARMRAAYRADESEAVQALCAALPLSSAATARIDRHALMLAQRVREALSGDLSAEAFLRHYGLSTTEGVVLMCIAEALLRIPDRAKADELIRDKIGQSDFGSAVTGGDSLLVNASTWGLMLTGRLVEWRETAGDEPLAILRRLVGRSSEPIIRAALTQAMRMMAEQFVMGQTIQDALQRAAPLEQEGYRFSYDMLGEAALSSADADNYFAQYASAIDAIAAGSRQRSLLDRPGISVKLSALHPRYQVAQRERVMTELLARLRSLALQAARAGINLTIDAEESYRLTLSLELLEALARDPALADWDGLGLAVQAYQKRALHVIDWLIALAAHTRRRWMIRLVKGAYWDSEIKLAQQLGLDYPVFTRKAATDVSYLACAHRLMGARGRVFPQFATHNVRTVATILELAEGRRDFEFQKLHGMGGRLYEQIVGASGGNFPCRIYAPVGSHRDLLPYLVRRLLENGANSSFVHQIGDSRVPLGHLVADPIAAVRGAQFAAHPSIPRPRSLYGDRTNSMGVDLSDEITEARLAEAVAASRRASSSGAESSSGLPARLRVVTEPANRQLVVGAIAEVDDAQLDQAIGIAAGAASGWESTPVDQRAACLERAADLLEANIDELLVLCVREAGKTLPDAVAEVREAIDYCRYYAAQARSEFAAPERLPGPTGESNELSMHGRGVFACISPWNFPLAIFVGQVSAALAAGNAALAKPAEQTPLIAARAVALLHEAGVPQDVLQLTAGSGETVGARLVADPRIAGVVFTGSVETARAINLALARREGPIIPLIAETGGLNAMIVDSTALPEQVVTDVIASAFQSAGQRCSSLRVLCLQQEIAPRVIDLLAGAMRELRIGDPALPAVDIGPVIDSDAKRALEIHLAKLREAAQPIFELALPGDCVHGDFFAPCAFEIELAQLPRKEVFGPILHVLRYRSENLDSVLDAIVSTGYGLTLGIHSRISRFADDVRRRLKVGNTYVNRNMIGAVVGVQPFGGEGLSGTGPKAGGPHYLQRFAVERTVSVNTAAAGGNASLMAEIE